MVSPDTSATLSCDSQSSTPSHAIMVEATFSNSTWSASSTDHVPFSRLQPSLPVSVPSSSSLRYGVFVPDESPHVPVGSMSPPESSPSSPAHPASVAGGGDASDDGECPLPDMVAA